MLDDISLTRVPRLAQRISIPLHTRSQSLYKDTFGPSAHQVARPVCSTNATTSPARSPVVHGHTTKEVQPGSKSRTVKYTWDDGPRDTPGTAAYYKSRAFRKAVDNGSTLVPGQGDEASKNPDSADESYNKRPKQVKRRSLVVIFSKASVRRATSQRKVDRRMQRANRRLKMLRPVGGIGRGFK